MVLNLINVVLHHVGLGQATFGLGHLGDTMSGLDDTVKMVANEFLNLGFLIIIPFFGFNYSKDQWPCYHFVYFLDIAAK